MKKLRGTLNFKIQKKDMETPQGVSMTVPDDGYTVQELLEKHAQGLALGIQRLGQFMDTGDEDYDDIDINQLSNMDITEKMAKLKENEDTINVGKAAILEKKRRKDDAEKLKNVDAS